MCGSSTPRPVDSPSDARFDTARFSAAGTMTVTGGAAVGTTSTGTLIPTTTGANPALTTTPGTTRSTRTGTANGSPSPRRRQARHRRRPSQRRPGAVVPTVARVHAAGQPVDAYDCVYFAF